MNKQAKKLNLWDIFWTIFWLFLLVLVILKFLVFQHVTVVGKSMFPNYDDGQLLLVNQLDKEFSRGQVVAVYSNPEVAKDADYFTRFSAQFFLKRVIGMPGEEIEIVGSKVIIYNQDYPQGRLLAESYIPDSTIESEEKRDFYFPKTSIPSDSYFVMGDNRSNSTDSRSRSLGPVKDYAMFGQEAMRFWPFNQLEVFELPRYSFEPIPTELKERRADLKEKEAFLSRRYLD